MNIIILCDQLTCKYNSNINIQGNQSLFPACIHTNPSFIITTKNLRCCKSKTKRLPVISPSCNVCEDPSSTNCLNCCHNKYIK